MLKIKFSEKYNKMVDNIQGKVPRRAILLETFIAETKDLHPKFIEYDTTYWDPKEKGWAYYKLPQGKVIVLLLRTEYHKDEVMMWTTIRRYTPKKFEYYKKNKMEVFEIMINK